MPWTKAYSNPGYLR